MEPELPTGVPQSTGIPPVEVTIVSSDSFPAMNDGVSAVVAWTIDELRAEYVHRPTSKIRFSNGERYEGTLSEDGARRSGFGKYFYHDGAVYEGEFACEHPHGRGLYSVPHRNHTYIGHFRGGSFHGLGKLDCPQLTLAGNFCRGKLEGQGIRVCRKDSSRYDGHFKQGKRDGKGRMITYEDGKIKCWYEGDWARGAKTGRGLFVFSDGARYEGDMSRDQLHGQGKYSYANGNLYEGEWVQDQREGRGTLRIAAGVYTGTFYQNAANDPEGVFRYNNGAVYEGAFVGGCINGRGTIRFPNGDGYSGEFQDNKLTGYGEYTYANGDKFVGVMMDGKPAGNGCFTVAANKKEFTGEFYYDKQADQIKSDSCWFILSANRHICTFMRYMRDVFSSYDVTSIEPITATRVDRQVLASHAIPESELRDGHALSRGGYGQVLKGKYGATTVAWKTLLLSNQENEDEFMQEVLMLSKLKHPNIVFFYGYTMPPKPKLVMEFLDGGSLFDLLYKKRIQLPFYKKVEILFNVACGLRYLHARRPPRKPIIHRDMKTMNILLSQDLTEVKIADFGLSKFQSHTVTEVVHCGTAVYTSPEALRREKCSSALDTFSFGIIMWELLHQRFPFHGYSVPQVVMAICQGNRPECPGGDPPPRSDAKRSYVELMHRAWAQNPRDRPSDEELCTELENILCVSRLDAPTRAAGPSSVKSTPRTAPARAPVRNHGE